MSAGRAPLGRWTRSGHGDGFHAARGRPKGSAEGQCNPVAPTIVLAHGRRGRCPPKAGKVQISVAAGDPVEESKKESPLSNPEALKGRHKGTCWLRPFRAWAEDSALKTQGVAPFGAAQGRPGLDCLSPSGSTATSGGAAL
jgi:hypothetical protein